MGNSTSNAVAERLEHASKTGVLSLRDLKLEQVSVESGCGLKFKLFVLCFQVPANISTVKSKLRTLDVSFNRIPLLPEMLGEFTNLRILSLNNNRIGMVDLCCNSLLWLYIHLFPRTIAFINWQHEETGDISPAIQLSVFSARQHAGISNWIENVGPFSQPSQEISSLPQLTQTLGLPQHQP